MTDAHQMLTVMELDELKVLKCLPRPLSLAQVELAPLSGPTKTR